METNESLEKKAIDFMDSLVYNFKGSIQNVFDKHKIEAEVNTENVSNAILAFSKNPNFVKDFKDVTNMNAYDGTEADFGAGIMRVAKKALSANQNRIDKKNAPKETVTPMQTTTTPTAEISADKPKPKSILGMNPYLFYGLLTVLFLVIIVAIVHSTKK